MIAIAALVLLADSARFAAVETWKGEFQAVRNEKLVMPNATQKVDVTLKDGSFEISGHHVEGGLDIWSGPAHATLDYRSRNKVEGGGATMDSHIDTGGRQDGTAELRLDQAHGHYQLIIKLTALPAENVTTGPLPGMVKRYKETAEFEPGAMHLNAPLPGTGLDLVDKHDCVGGATNITKCEVSWTMKPEDDLKAIASVAEVERGKPSLLDGSKSIGRIRSWKWTLTPAAGCPAGGSTKNFDGPASTVAVTLLCNTTVTLEVTDGRKTDQTTVTASVRPRKWKTKFDKGKVTPFDGSGPPPGDVPKDRNQKDVADREVHMYSPNGGAAEWIFGRNLCAVGPRHSGDVIHHRAADWDHSWKLEPLHDAHSPWDGQWYVTEQDLRVYRTPFVNAMLTSGSEMETQNSFDAAHKKAFADLKDAVAEHEMTHGVLFQEKLAREKPYDPAPVIEPFYAGSENELDTQVKSAVSASEDLFGGQIDAFEQEVHRRLCQKPRFNRSASVMMESGGAWRDTPLHGKICDIGD